MCIRDRINIPEQDDEFNDIRSEYSEMLQNQLTKGNNGLITVSYTHLDVYKRQQQM